VSKCIAGASAGIRNSNGKFKAQ